MNAIALSALVALPPVAALVADTMLRRRKPRLRSQPLRYRSYQRPVYLGYDSGGALTTVTAAPSDVENQG